MRETKAIIKNSDGSTTTYSQSDWTGIIYGETKRDEPLNIQSDPYASWGNGKKSPDIFSGFIGEILEFIAIIFIGIFEIIRYVGAGLIVLGGIGIFLHFLINGRL